MQFLSRISLALCVLVPVSGAVSAQSKKTLFRTISTTSGHQQQYSGDVFAPISKYMVQGDAVSLSAWFADNLDISIFSQGGDASKAQARQIIKSFFDSYTPRSFVITHTAAQGTTKYALADFHAGGETFRVTVFLNCGGDGYRIQQLKIERP